MVNRLYQHAVLQKEKEDFAHVVSDAEQRLKSADLHVGDDFVQRWFESEAIRDPLLRSAWDNRLRSEQHWRYADKLVEKSFGKLMKFLKSQPDPQVTADKAAVVAALKSGSTSKAPEDPPVRYGDLTDREFATEKKRLGIG